MAACQSLARNKSPALPTIDDDGDEPTSAATAASLHALVARVALALLLAAPCFLLMADHPLQTCKREHARCGPKVRLVASAATIRPVHHNVRVLASRRHRSLECASLIERTSPTEQLHRARLRCSSRRNTLSSECLRLCEYSCLQTRRVRRDKSSQVHLLPERRLRSEKHCATSQSRNPFGQIQLVEAHARTCVAFVMQSPLKRETPTERK